MGAIEKNQNFQTYEGSTVLLVDDDADLLALEAEVLGELGFHVLQASDGLEAIRLVEETHCGFDLAFLDFNMPGLNGVQTLKVLRELCPGVRAILCSATSKDECFRECTLEGLTYLEKPFRIQDLERVLKLVLSGTHSPLAYPI